MSFMKNRIISIVLFAVLLFSAGLSSALVAESVEPQVDERILVSSLDFSDIEEYDSLDFIEIHDNHPDFYGWQLTNEPYVHFSELDELGRTGPALALLGSETLATEPRGQIGNVQPSGWHTIRYDDLIADKYLYNRAHVIGYQLCGDNATPQNLFAGTRYLNTGAMLIFEEKVADYINRTGNHVLYRVTPFYDGNNLLASGVQMEACSIEDNGSFQFNVYCYNVQPGILIDYSTGDSEIEPDYIAPILFLDGAGKNTDAPITREINTISETTSPSPTKTPAPTGTPTKEAPQSKTPTYVLNTNTHKFHYSWCSSVDQMKPSNRKDFYGTRDEAISKGYSPCGRCHP